MARSCFVRSRRLISGRTALDLWRRPNDPIDRNVFDGQLLGDRRREAAADVDQRSAGDGHLHDSGDLAQSRVGAD